MPPNHDLGSVAERAHTFWRVATTRAPIAQSPKQAIWTLGNATLYRYDPVLPPEQRHPVPLLLVFAIMNRPSIFDLRPGHSFVEYMLGRGYDVYLLDWGVPGPEDRNLTLDDYALDYLPRAVRKLRSVTGSDEFSLLGWCIGAILTTLYAALRPEDGLRNLILLTAPLDFSDAEAVTFVRWLDQDHLNLERLIDRDGNVSGELLDIGMKMLRPVQNYLGNYMRVWENMNDPHTVVSWHAMHTWVNDLAPMSGAALRQLVTQFFRENRLAKGTLIVSGETVRLDRVRANLLNVIAQADHITPPAQSEHIMAQFGSADKQLLKIPGGHIGAMAGSGARKHTWPAIDDWLAARSKTSKEE
ncbi:MAG: alpha/beta fold hydrolase [Gemmatimonadota bacterium]|nr:alpha/beta fold hydrolase [Gemmatimonadota bacterium]